jgi:hypothetical protein
MSMATVVISSNNKLLHMDFLLQRKSDLEMQIQLLQKKHDEVEQPTEEEEEEEEVEVNGWAFKRGDSVDEQHYYTMFQRPNDRRLFYWPISAHHWKNAIIQYVNVKQLGTFRYQLCSEFLTSSQRYFALNQLIHLKIRGTNTNPTRVLNFLQHTFVNNSM